MAARTERKRGKVLVVEDEFLVSLGLESLLEDFGFEVIGPAGRLDEALDRACEPDLRLAVLDINLRGEMSWPVARALRSLGVPFLFLTGYPRSHVECPADLDHAPMCTKPVDAFQLRAVIDSLLHAQPT